MSNQGVMVPVGVELEKAVYHAYDPEPRDYVVLLQDGIKPIRFQTRFEPTDFLEWFNLDKLVEAYGFQWLPIRNAYSGYFDEDGDYIWYKLDKVKGIIHLEDCVSYGSIHWNDQKYPLSCGFREKLRIWLTVNNFNQIRKTVTNWI